MTDQTGAGHPRKQLRIILVVAILGAIGGGIGLVFLIRPQAQARVDPPGTETKNNNSVRQVGLSLCNYSSGNRSTPGPYLDADQGVTVTVPQDPTKRLSWRVTLLPYVEQDHLYSQFNKSEAWDSPTNAPPSRTHIGWYSDFADGPLTNSTPYRGFYDNGALFDTNPKNRIRLDDIPDGASNTLLFAESSQQVPWAQFNEHHFESDGPLPPLGRADRNSFLVAMADGSVRVVKKSVSTNTLRATITRAGGDAVGADW